MADFFESFDNGVGQLSHLWGRENIDTSVPGQITVSGNAGAMQRPWSADSGFGYGTYTVVASLEGDVPGPAALLWPADDQWPGGEYDIVEIHDGRAYGTVHWNNDGGDDYTSMWFDGLDHSQKHTYTLDWQPGQITYYIDGEKIGTVDENVGADFAHGGINAVFSIMNRSDQTSITAYEVSYTAGDGAVPAAPAPVLEEVVAPAPVEEVIDLAEGIVDWNALAAQVMANYAADGAWYL